MKKLFCVLALLLVLPRAGAVSAQGAVVIDADTGETLFEQNADSRLPMASTTKIMTALVALGEGDLDRVYTVKPEYAAVEGSSMYLQAGERLSLRDTLYGLMLASGNDAAVAIAGECGGMNAFVGKMNAKAAELGLTDTHFDNPNGLPRIRTTPPRMSWRKSPRRPSRTRCSGRSSRQKAARSAGMR